MNNAVIYTRFSSTGQNEQTIDGQLRICKEYAEKMGFRVVKVYNDKARTGTNDRRPEFQAMIEEAGLGVFQYIIVYKFDRFARNRLDSMMYKGQLKKEHGIKVVSATEPVSDDEGGEIYEMFLEWNDEKYSQRLSKRVRDGMITALENGTYTGQRLAYGYKFIDTEKVGKKGTIHKVAIDESQAEIVRFIFTEYANGTPKKEIAEQLNAQGKRIKGQLFNIRTFESWLSNIKYTGEFERFGRVWTNIYPQIIEKDTFKLVQQRMASNRIYTRKDSIKQKYLLTGKCYCGHCGNGMTADGGNKPEKVYRYYACKMSRRGKGCDKRLEHKEKLEKYVVQKIVEYLRCPKRLRLIAQQVIEYYKGRTGEREIKAIETNIVNAQKQIEQTTQAFIEAVTMKNELLKQSCNEKITGLGILIEDLKQQKAQLTFERGLQATEKDIINFVNEFIQPQVMYENLMESDEEYSKRIIDNLINAVYIYDDKIVVWFNIKGGKDIPFIDKNTTDTATQKAPNTTLIGGSDANVFGGSSGT